MARHPTRSCPCDPNRNYADCCGRWHADTPAPDAESLMRSRYAAYVLGLGDYLLATWHPSTRPRHLSLDANSEYHTTWLGLKIKDHAITGSDTAVVEFIARFREGGGSASRLHERSRFVRENGKWYYLDGEVDLSP